MKVSVLFSGGKDSALAAILLEPLFEVELVTCTFSLLSNGSIGSEAAEKLEMRHRIVCLENSILDDAYQIIVQDGFPKNALNYIHLSALKTLAEEKNTKFIADGVRRDDRVPRLNNSQIRSLEDKYSISYISPLGGYGRSAVNALVAKHLLIHEDKSENLVKADYESELREKIACEIGGDAVKELFPPHVQSRIIERIK